MPPKRRRSASGASAGASGGAGGGGGAASLWDFTATDIDGAEVDFATDERIKETYTQLNDMFARLGTKGFAPLAFPSNDFKQEYVDDAKIKTTMAAKFDPKFPMFSRVHVNGKDAAPVFKFLKERLPEGKKGKDIRHNFAKFLVDRNGQPVKRYDPSVPPLSIEEDILELLGTDSDGAAASSKPAKKARGKK